MILFEMENLLGIKKIYHFELSNFLKYSFFFFNVPWRTMIKKIINTVELHLLRQYCPKNRGLMMWMWIFSEELFSVLYDTVDS